MLLNGSYTFVSFKYKCKIVSYINNNNNKKILIVTFLGENQYIKNNDKIIII